MGSKKTSAKVTTSAKGSKAAPPAKSAATETGAAQGKSAPAKKGAATDIVFRKALGHIDGTLEGVTVVTGDHTAELSYRGQLFATLRIDGDEMVATLRKPEGPVPLPLKPALLKEGPKGWLEFRTPVSRDPSPWLQAGIGMTVGRTVYEIGHAGEPEGAPAEKASAAPAARPFQGPISSGGGPYIVLPQAVASAWPGAGDKAAYEEIGRGPDEGRLSRLAGREILILGTPDNLYAASLPHGAVLARVVSFDADDDALLAKLLQKLPAEEWEPLGKLEVADGPLLAFDAAIAGADAGTDALRIELSPGSYAVASRTFEPDAGTELLLTRLTRAGV
jgi:Immunity protein 21